jgi:DNA-binding response OmpR family regulator
MLKILIIEDDEELAQLLHDRLQAEGFEVLITYDAYQGVEFVHKRKPDLIILDLMLPAGGGAMVLKNIKLSSYTATIPVLVLTGLEEEEYKKKLGDIEVREVIKKPFEHEQLIAAIRNIFGQ